MSEVCVFGSINMDVVARVAHLPAPGETCAALGLALVPGGKGANQAVAAARMGVPCALIGALGQDDHGAALAAFLGGEGLGGEGLGLDGVARVPGPSGMALIAIDAAGENQIVVVAGANALARAPALPVAPADGPRPVALAQLELPPAEVAAFLDRAAQTGWRTMLNAAPAIAAARDLAAVPEILVVNETELAHCAGRALPDGVPEGVPDVETVVALARSLPRGADRVTVVTLGAQGVVALAQGQVHVVPAPRVAVVDTVGAGDCFCGVLAAELALGALLPRALEVAVAAASLAVQRPGAAQAMPRRTELAI